MYTVKNIQAHIYTQNFYAFQLDSVCLRTLKFLKKKWRNRNKSQSNGKQE